MQKIEFDVAASTDKLLRPLRCSERTGVTSTNDGRIGVKKRGTDVPGECEVGSRVAGIVMVEKNTA